MAKKNRSFSDELVALGVRPDVARAFAVTNNFQAPSPQELRTGAATLDSSVSANSGRATETTSHVTQIPGPPPGAPGSHAPVRGTGDAKQDAPFTNPVTSGSAGGSGGVGGGRLVDPDTGKQVPVSSQGSSTTPGATITGTVTPVPGTDWRQYLTDWGFPPDMVDELNKIFSQYTDPNQAAAAALAYIRGTDWYAQHFPGIGQAEQNGLVSNEADYRQYVANANALYQRFLGRAPTTDEILGYIKNNYSPTMIGEHVQGVAYLKNPQNVWNLDYTLGAFDSGKVNKSQYGSLADSLFGLNNPTGDALQTRLQAAQAKFQRIFQGVSASPALSMLSNGQLAERDASKKPDVGA